MVCSQIEDDIMWNDFKKSPILGVEAALVIRFKDSIMLN